MKRKRSNSISEASRNGFSLHIFDLEPYLLEKIVAFAEDEVKFALQASNKKWYWHVHQCKAHRERGDAVRFGLLQRKPEKGDILPESERPLFILTRQNQDGGLRPGASFLTECYLRSILRFDSPVRIAYDEQQRSYLPDFLELLVHFGTPCAKTTRIIFLIKEAALMNDITNFRASAVARGPCLSKMIFAVELSGSLFAFQAPRKQLRGYLPIANSYCVTGQDSLNVLSSFYNGPSMSISQSRSLKIAHSILLTGFGIGPPLSELTFFKSEDLQTLLSSASRHLFDVFPYINDMTIHRITEEKLSIFPPLFGVHGHLMRNLDLFFDEFANVDQFPLEHLPNLRSLSLESCRLQSSSLLESISKLQQLVTLSLDVASMSRCATLSFGDMSCLSTLRLRLHQPPGRNSLDKSFDRLKSLTALDLSYVDLSHLDRLPFDNLGSLQDLCLEECDLHGETILDGLGNLHNLTAIVLSGNQLTAVKSLPFEELTKLQELILESCHLNGENILKGIQNLEALTSLHLSFNDLSLVRRLPFERLRNLHHLSVSDCKLRGQHVLDSLHALTMLHTLSLNGNCLSSVDELLLQNMFVLKKLDLQNCSLVSMTTFEGLRGLQELETLVLSGNNLSSLRWLPLTNKFDLRHIDLEACRLNGPDILDSLSDLRRLETLNLSKNDFQRVDCLPFHNLHSLRTLSLGECQLNGIEILVGLRRLKTLESLDLSKNDFREVSELPFDDLQNLRHLTMSFCHLSGNNILVGLETLRNLQDLDMSSNSLQLVDRLPFDDLAALKRLTLGSCGLSGKRLLRGLGHASDLQKLSLQDNDLSQVVEFPFQVWTSLKELCLTNCQVHVPSFVKNLPALTSCTALDLSDNDFGAISRLPLSQMRNLATLSLRDCNLRDGTVVINDLHHLQNCDLSCNEITDSRSFAVSHASHPALQHLNMSFNPVARDTARVLTDGQQQLFEIGVLKFDLEIE